MAVISVIYVNLLWVAAHSPTVKPMGDVLLRWAFVFAWFAMPAAILYYLIQMARHSERVARAQERIALTLEAASATSLGLVDIALQSAAEAKEKVPSEPEPGSGENP